MRFLIRRVVLVKTVMIEVADTNAHVFLLKVYAELLFVVFDVLFPKRKKQNLTTTRLKTTQHLRIVVFVQLTVVAGNLAAELNYY